jgi:hypothetical protein
MDTSHGCVSLQSLAACSTQRTVLLPVQPVCSDIMTRFGCGVYLVGCRFVPCCVARVRMRWTSPSGEQQGCFVDESTTCHKAKEVLNRRCCSLGPGMGLMRRAEGVQHQEYLQMHMPDIRALALGV